MTYEKDTGVNVHKLVTVFHPPGKIAHVTVGFAGLYGALTGFSTFSLKSSDSLHHCVASSRFSLSQGKYGISVHEANLEEKHETFRGFPWVLRLRFIDLPFSFLN